jgi:hypothetical protein
MTRPVREFMQGGCRKFFRAIESEIGRKLDVIGARRIESTIAADADHGAAVLENDLRRFGARPSYSTLGTQTPGFPVSGLSLSLHSLRA